MRTKMEKQNELGSQELAASIPSREYMEAPKRLNYPYLITRDTSPSRVNLEVFKFSPSDGCPATATCLVSTQALRSRRVSSTSKHLGASNQGGQTAPWAVRPAKRLDRPTWAVRPTWVAALSRRVFGLGFVAQPSKPVVFW
jgi:hypothetical protein